jgi:hypothetical protein
VPLQIDAPRSRQLRLRHVQRQSACGDQRCRRDSNRFHVNAGQVNPCTGMAAISALPKRSECGSQFRAEKLGLLPPRREVSALVDLTGCRIFAISICKFTPELTGATFAFEAGTTLALFGCV